MPEMRETAFLQLVRKRTSCRSYRPDPVPRQHIDAMLEAARWAPSACNRQPWRFAVVTAPERRRRLADEGTLPGIHMPWIADAPVVIVAGTEKTFLTHTVAPKVSGVDYAPVDLGIAVEHLVLQATELGLGTCWIGWIRQNDVRCIVEWPRSVAPQVLVTVGWPAEGAERQRVRSEIDEIVKWLE